MMVLNGTKLGWSMIRGWVVVGGEGMKNKSQRTVLRLVEANEIDLIGGRQSPPQTQGLGLWSPLSRQNMVLGILQ